MQPQLLIEGAYGLRINLSLQRVHVAAFDSVLKKYFQTCCLHVALVNTSDKHSENYNIPTTLPLPPKQ